ncbi:hypothetical protein H4582DRAFT_2085731 [Lactarius indigo]|nr:hypothetical protein H4582DRAFT_2085731 [Lactarius indigo]
MEQSSGSYGTEMSNHIFQTYYNLCRLNKGRQEEIAWTDVIPLLMHVIESAFLLRNFHLYSMRLTSAGKSCQILLRQHDGLAVYIRLLMGPYFQVSSLESILVWLQEETARVEKEVAKPKSLDALLKCFVSTKAGSFENLLDPFLKFCQHSIGIAKAQFFRRVTEKLNNSKAVGKVNLLRTLRAVCDVHPNRAQPVKRYGTHETVAAFWCKVSTVLVLDRDEPHTCAKALSQRSRYTQELDRAEEMHHAPHGKRYVGNRHASSPLGTGPMNNPRVTSAGAGLGAGTTGGLLPRLPVGDIQWQSGIGAGRCRAATKQNARAVVGAACSIVDVSLPFSLSP